MRQHEIVAPVVRHKNRRAHSRGAHKAAVHPLTGRDALDHNRIVAMVDTNLLQRQFDKIVELAAGKLAAGKQVAGTRAAGTRAAGRQAVDTRAAGSQAAGRLAADTRVAGKLALDCTPALDCNSGLQVVDKSAADRNCCVSHHKSARYLVYKIDAGCNPQPHCPD